MPALIKSSSNPEPDLLRAPLCYSGSFDKYESVDLTAAIGREYPKVQLHDIIDDDTKIRDLAILCSQRGVVFFRNQGISTEQLKHLTNKLGELTGKPEESKVGLDMTYSVGNC
jgi:alpha-ketoglutarate-dependent taurine dioxygenase